MKKQDISGIQINYQDVGGGPAVLLVHGFPLDLTLWNHQLESFKSDYRLIAPDLRGHGQSEVTPGPYSMDLLAEDLYTLLQRLGIEQVVLVGLSMGGYIAFAFWRSYPKLVRALVLADTRAGVDTPEGRQNRYAMIDRVRAEGTKAIADAMLPNLLSPSTLENKPDVVDHARRMMAHTPAGGVIGALGGMAQRPDSTSTLATITVPTLIVVGEQDAITPPSEAEAMQQAILAAHPDLHVGLVVIHEAGHLAPLENPAAFNQALREFLVALPH